MNNSTENTSFGVISEEDHGLPFALRGTSTMVGLMGFALNSYSAKYIWSSFNLTKTVYVLVFCDAILNCLCLFPLMVQHILFPIPNQITCFNWFLLTYLSAYYGGLFTAEVAAVRLVGNIKSLSLYYLLIIVSYSTGTFV
jgi:hypothetical protein